MEFIELIANNEEYWENLKTNFGFWAKTQHNSQLNATTIIEWFKKHQPSCNRDRDIVFMNWLRDKAQPRSINRNWILNEDRKEYSAEEILDIFIKQSDADERSVAPAAE